jgi:hypothetical protein
MNSIGIKRNDTVKIRAMGRTIAGIVQSAVNYDRDGQDDWYIEFTDSRGQPHYWKQGLDGRQLLEINGVKTP